jgi:TRAP-type C4-dicarboxylate transport system permease small subunit
MKLEKLINFGIPILCGVLLLVIVLLCCLQVALREFFNFGLSWSDEVSQYCMTWLVLFGSTWVTINGQHLNTGIKLHQKFNEKQICLIDGVLALLIAGITAVVAYRSAIFALQRWNMESLTLRWLKMGWIFCALPLSMLAVSYYYLKSFFKNIMRILKKDQVI